MTITVPSASCHGLPDRPERSQRHPVTSARALFELADVSAIEGRHFTHATGSRNVRFASSGGPITRVGGRAIIPRARGS